MPNHLFPAKPKLKRGAVMLGDSLNMRHPLTGGGMTVALTDVHSLGSKLIALIANARHKTQDVRHEGMNSLVKQFYASRHKQNATVNILADALYGVMSNDDLKKACYDYLARGGNYSAEPVSILSAVSRDVTLLMRHFFAVAFYGAKNILSPFPTRERIVRSYRMLKAAVHIIAPLVLNERPNRLTKTAFRVMSFLM